MQMHGASEKRRGSALWIWTDGKTSLGDFEWVE